MRPDLFARRSVQRNDRVVLREHIHRVVDYERVEGVLVVIARRIRPGDLQFAYVGSINLAQRGVLRCVRSAPIVFPASVVLRKERNAGRSSKKAADKIGNIPFMMPVWPPGIETGSALRGKMSRVTIGI